MKEIDVRLEVLRRLCAEPGVRSESGIARLAAAFPGHEELVREVCSRTDSSPESDESLAGSIGGYRLVRHIGSGSMGDVYEAIQESPRRTVALKLLRPGLGLASRERFEREVEALSRMRHPGITRIYDAGIHESPLGERPYFIMEWVSGQTLKRYRDMLPSDDDARDAETIRLLRCLCAALQHAHEQGVIHRDVKPSNVLVDESGQPKLIDFGIALFRDERLERLTRTRHFVGTEQYASPEQLRADRVVDERSDVYALGVLGRELARPAELTRPWWSAWRGSDLERVLAKAAAPDKAGRYPSAEEMAEDLARVMNREPIRARGPSALYPVGMFVRRRPTAAVVGAAGVLTLVSIVVAAFAAEVRAREASRNYLHLALIDELERLCEDEESLWPAIPERLTELRSWRDRYDRLLGELSAASPRTDAEPLSVSAESDRVRGMRQLSEQIAEVREKGLEVSVSIQARIDSALEVDRLWRECAPAWEHAVRSIGDPEECPRYRGLLLKPQRFLRPIERNPRTGLWEFEHLVSRPPGGVGATFVLLPGGAFTMGAQASSPDEPRFDALAHSIESPGEGGEYPHAQLDAFFVSKFELTVQQWQTADGASRRMYRNQFDPTDPHPITDVSWVECERILWRLGLALPTELQWEYAARAGSELPYVWGSSPACLEGRANVVGLDSAVDIHARVGSYAPNDFGLHDVLGNAAEWCRDERSYYGVDGVRDGDGVFVGHRRGEGRRVVRGGSFNTAAVDARVSARRIEPEGNNGDDLGVRPIRGVDVD